MHFPAPTPKEACQLLFSLIRQWKQLRPFGDKSNSPFQPALGFSYFRQEMLLGVLGQKIRRFAKWRHETALWLTGKHITYLQIFPRPIRRRWLPYSGHRQMRQYFFGSM